ncbi:hypothetical protein JAAARDRAFT_118947 [Jaapia argillacea MUCL 33604]|uniref:Uncharacterized protein n=1 Tax=Jaapia argillacea MUCL 33604 TaxID=933084 RepID=A0A067QMH6_9AGAM|nr:hypothetical protein JAAARDRAFT_118947 [Jaapia argillacea MUCL 33604]
MSANILDPSAVLSALPKILPLSSKNLKSSQDGLAALLHATMAAVGFRLIGVDETGPARSIPDNVLPDEWNAHGPGSYAFRYRHEQSSLEFIVKVVKLGSRTLVNAIAVESDKAASLDISTNDFVSPSFFPHDLSSSEAQPLVHGFISSNRVADLLSQYKLSIIQKLVPGLNKPGYAEEPSTADSSTNAGGAPPSTSRQNPPPARPQPVIPPYSPESEPGRIPYSHIPPQNPLQIGRRDLDPFPQNPFAPPPLFPSNAGDGMFVGPDHPIWGRGRGGFGGNSSPQGPWGGDGFLPPMGAPPGARFDPVGPGLGPFPSRGGFGGRGQPRAPPGPDNDEFMPPGMVSSSDPLTGPNSHLSIQGDMFS